MNDRDLKSAYRSLKRRGSDADKARLLARLNAEVAPASLRERWHIWMERVWPTVRTPALGFSLALVMVAMVSLSMRPPAPNDEVPEIVDLEFDGGSAMVFEDQVEHTTLIWLSEVQEDELEEADESDEKLDELIDSDPQPVDSEAEKI